MKEFFGVLPTGEEVGLYTISCGSITAKVTDYGATLVQLLVPDRDGRVSDVVLGYDSWQGYAAGDGFLGATVGRNANRVKDARFPIGERQVTLTANEGANNLHSGPDCFHLRLWAVESQREDAITFFLYSPHGDQGFPGNAQIRVTYRLEAGNVLRICYDGICDQDTVFNMTNHSYFNLAGHEKPELGLLQTLMMPAPFFYPDDGQNIPTGERRSVAGTPMDFRSPKALCRDIEVDYEPLHLQGGYDHNFEVTADPCAVLHDPSSGRTMAVSTDCPGLQVYTANFLADRGKGGIFYPRRCAVALETQYCPDSVNHPQWPQPFTKAGEKYHSQTSYRFY